MLAVKGAAQTSFRQPKRVVPDTVPVLVNKYVDSLKLYKQGLDSILRYKDSVDTESVLDAKYYRLFTPLTFYYNIAGDRFNLDTDTVPSPIDMSLLSVYFNRPDLVKESQKQLDKAGTILKPSSGSVSPNVTISDKVETDVTEHNDVPINVIIKKPNFWRFFGDFSLHANQYYQSGNWFQGGESNYNFKTSLILKANYDNKKNFTWENTLEFKLAVINTRADTVHNLRVNGDNLLRYTGKVGLRATQKWRYTIQLIATTQLFRQFRSNDHKVYSDIFSPLRVNPSIGMDYSVNWLKGRLTGSVNIAPFSYSMTYCHRGNIAHEHGIKPGRHFIDNYGSQISANLNLKITNNISWSTRIYGFTSYQHTLFENENTFRFRVNKYLSADLFVYPRFDDSRQKDEDHGYWHYKENLSFGLTYSF